MTPSKTHLSLLRAALGLGAYVTTPTRSTLPQHEAKGRDAEVAELVEMGYFSIEPIHGEGGLTYHTTITEAGRALVMNHQPQPQGTTMEAQSLTKKTRSRTAKPAADAAPDKDTRTGDLLDNAAPPFDFAPVPAEAAAGAVGDLALVTMNPAKFVATIFQPFKDRFEQLRADADVVAVDESDFQRLAEQQQAQPEGQRRPVSRLDLTTKDGMATAVKLRAGFRDEVRLATERTRAAKKEPFLKIGQELDAQSKPIKDGAATYEDRFDKAIKAEEQRKQREKEEAERREAERVAAIRAMIAVFTELPAKLAAADSATLTAKLEELAVLEPGADEYAEFAGEAAMAIDAAGAALAELLQAALAREEEKRRQLEEQEAERARLAAAEAEAARLREEQQRQNKAMAEITAIQNIAKSDGSANELQILLGEVQAQQLDPAMFGQMLGVATMARDVAITSLQTKIAAKRAEEEAALLLAPELAPEPEAGADDGGDVPQTFKQLTTIEGLEPIDWDAPMAAPQAAQPATIVGAFADAEPSVEESPAVQAFLAAVRDLRKTHSAEAICELLANELEGVAA